MDTKNTSISQTLNTPYQKVKNTSDFFLIAAGEGICEHPSPTELLDDGDRDLGCLEGTLRLEGAESASAGQTHSSPRSQPHTQHLDNAPPSPQGLDRGPWRSGNASDPYHTILGTSWLACGWQRHPGRKSRAQGKMVTARQLSE